MSTLHSSIVRARAIMSGAVVAALLGTLIFLWLRQGVVASAVMVIDDRVRVRVEVAATPLAREKGLSGHAPLAGDQGMLFLFDAPRRHGFWMKDMTFPIDIIWIWDDKIADITVNAAVPVKGEDLPVYAPKVAVDKVLEVPAGFAATHGLRIGAPVKFE